MASVIYKILGQVAPTGMLENNLYLVPALRSAVVSSITVANRGPDLAKFRVSISVNNAATNAKDYLYYDVPLPGYDTFIATVGLTLGANDVIRVYASGLGGDDLTFQAFGSEFI